MEVINNIYLDQDKKVISYFYPIKLKAPLFKRIGERQEIKVSGTKDKGVFTGKNAVIFTVNVYRIKLKNRPDLITLSYANNTIPCRKIVNDTYIEVKGHSDKNGGRSSRELIEFSILTFEIPTTKLLFYLEQKELPITLHFPHIEFKTTLKRQAKDYVEYITRYCDNKPIPQKLTDKINNEESRQKYAFYAYLFFGIIFPVIAIIAAMKIIDAQNLSRSESDLILMSIVGWIIGYSLIHFFVIRNLVGSNKSFFFRLLSIFY